MSRKLDLWIVGAILLLTAIVFYFTNLDIQISSLFWNATDGWFLKKEWYAVLLYKFGTMPAIFISVVGLFTYIGSHFKAKIKQYRIISFYLFMSMLLGPGLIVNAVFKDHYGRPRPRHIQEFNGHYEFKKLLVPGTMGKGKSFPCGHATMGFYLYVFYFLAKTRRKKVFWFSTATLLGGAIGFGRVIQGGHFTSDVIFAGGMIYLLCRWLYYGLKLNIHPYWDDESEHFIVKHKKKILIAAYALIPLGIIFILFASPYYKYKRNAVKKRTIQSAKQIEINLKIEHAVLNVAECDSILLILESQGFGFPESAVKRKYGYQSSNDSIAISYHTFKKGFFSEINSQLDAYLPSNKDVLGKIHLYESELRILSDYWILKKSKEGEFLLNRENGSKLEILREIKTK